MTRVWWAPSRVENRGETTRGKVSGVKRLVTSASTTTMSRSEIPGVLDVDLISKGVVVNTKLSCR